MICDQGNPPRADLIPICGHAIEPGSTGDRFRTGDYATESRGVAGQMDYVIAIRPQIITGIRLVGWCR
jgi:hypothetical protein